MLIDFCHELVEDRRELFLIVNTLPICISQETYSKHRIISSVKASQNQYCCCPDCAAFMLEHMPGDLETELHHGIVSFSPK